VTGHPGKCTGTSGILSYAEISSVLEDKALNAQVTFDSKEMVKIATWSGDQWIGYDDAETLKMKVDFANKHCMGGYVLCASSLSLMFGANLHYPVIPEPWFGQSISTRLTPLPARYLGRTYLTSPPAEASSTLMGASGAKNSRRLSVLLLAPLSCHPRRSRRR